MRRTLFCFGIFCLLFCWSSRSNAQDTLNLMVMYTGNARDGMGGRTAALTKIRSEVANINQTFQRNNINGFVKLAFCRSTEIEEQGCMYNLLNYVLTVKDQTLAIIDQQRGWLGIDVIVLIGDFPDLCGLAGEFGDPSQAWEIINYRCLGANYSMARQLGYLLGCGNNQKQSGRFNWASNAAHGYFYENDEDDSQSFTTIMGYTDERLSATESDFNMIPAWSDPNITYKGHPIGDAAHNNAQVIRDNLPMVCQYRAPYVYLRLQRMDVDLGETMFVKGKRALEVTDVEVDDGEAEFVCPRIRVKRAKLRENSRVHFGSREIFVH